MNSEKPNSKPIKPKRIKTGGRQRKYTSPTMTKSFRIPELSEPEVVASVKEIIKKHEK